MVKVIQITSFRVVIQKVIQILPNRGAHAHESMAHIVRDAVFSHGMDRRVTSFRYRTLDPVSVLL